jgi:hypothetical protein
LIKPIPPPYDPLEWRNMPFSERARLGCQAWAIQGYGTPLLVFVLYVLKIVFYIAMWIYFCSFSPGLGVWTSFSWWLQPVAFQKAIAWSLLFEVLGLGCGSGPLTARYMPIIGGCLYFLRPGTTKLPLFEGAPVIGRNTRGVLDVLGYLALVVASVLALIHPAPGQAQWLPIVGLVALLGVLDKTIFLAARAEHYWVTLVVFAFAKNWIAGAMIVQLALWFFAGFSKLNRHFPNVVCVMTSNSPFTPFGWFRKSMYRRYPDDLRPSSSARVHAYIGVALEMGTAIVLFSGVMLGNSAVIRVGLVMMVLLHTYIISTIPMGVPIEWNIMVIYGGFFFFAANGHVTPFDLGSIPVAVFLIVCSIIIPLLGNIKPAWVSFLLSMRYYAGNWAFSVWLFKGESYRKLDTLTKSSPWVYDQLDRFYEHKVSVGLMSKVMAWRLMHLHGRALQRLIPIAVDRFEDYEWVEGELMAGMVLGYNFGDGHLHSEQLLRSVQAQCGFEEGELRVIMVEAQALGAATLAYRIHDASSGQRAAGTINVRELQNLQPWSEASAGPVAS